MKKQYTTPTIETIRLYQTLLLANSDKTIHVGNNPIELEPEEETFEDEDYNGIFGD